MSDRAKHWLRIARKVVTTLAGLAVLALFLAWMGGAFREKVAPGYEEVARPSAAGRQLVRVELVRAEESVTAVASVQPRRKADVASQIIATIQEVKVQPGDKVMPGDPLIVLDDRELLAQQREAAAALSAAEADFDQRKREYDRVMSVGTAASKDEKDRATGVYNVAQAQVRRFREQVSRIEIQLTYTKIKAASAGVVADRFADPGDLAVPGKALLNIQDVHELELHAAVPESQALAVTIGQKLPLRIDAASVAGIGTVREIVPQAQQASRSVLIKVSLPTDLSAPIFAGMFGRVTVPIGQSSRLLVASSAIRQVGQLELAEVATPDGKLERRFVRTGRILDGKIEVLSGLSEGESVALPAK
jgi:RND family efflux transporter MFP subunit